jgi:Domain of unknown function (DUF1772)
MTRENVTFAVLLTYFWVMMILFGSIVFETFIIYPDVFHDPPDSLETALKFMSVRGPNNFYPPLGFLSWVAGTASVAMAWRLPKARPWVLASVAMIACEGLFSIAFFWPRNTIMFIEGSAVHSAAVLRKTAIEFQRLHWARFVFNAASAAFILKGVLEFHSTWLRRQR